jgi:hypothetical protein
MVPKRKRVSHWSTMRKGNASGSNLPYFLASKVLARKYNQTKIGYYVVPRTRTISPFKQQQTPRGKRLHISEINLIAEESLQIGTDIHSFQPMKTENWP